MDGDSLPVSAFKDIADGQFELGASAYEKRGVAAFVPHWDESKCIQCNNCANVCPHATIRPFALSADEAAAAPETMRMLPLTPAKKYPDMKYALVISPLDCMGCGVCVGVCPKGALSMSGQEAELVEQAASLPPTSRASSSRSRCLSSPAPAQAAPRPPMHAS